MPLRSGVAAKRPAVPKREPIGHVRRSQQITTYGVGALVAVDDQSFIVGALDLWKDDPGLVIREPRLERWLGVEAFRLPPSDDPSSGDGVVVRRFPVWYSCSRCEDLQEYRRFGSAANNVCNVCRTTLTPSRFIVACDHGHIDDFPYWKWVHYRDTSDLEPCRGGSLKLRSTGRSAALRSIVISCSCGRESTMEGAFGRTALISRGIHCDGGKPWSGPGVRDTGCDETPRTMQRGSSAAWFPIIRSALSIPPWSQRLQRLIDQYFDIWADEDDAVVLRQADKKLGASGYEPQEVLRAVQQRKALIEAGRVAQDEVPGGFEAGEELRRQEFKELCHTVEEGGEDVDFVCVPPDGADAVPPPEGLGRTMLVKRLREVRTLTSFVRVDMPSPVDPPARRVRLASDAVRWLPAVEVVGEGVFLRIDDRHLADWERRESVLKRADIVRTRHEEALRRRSGDARIISRVSPRYLLVHTLAHALINEWSLDAGYSASALRERLYVDEAEMAGLLIYTATSDSAGSLGGVVAQGLPERLAVTLRSALARASWCSADPLCMEADATGTDSLNLAACHACVLLPETSCETYNTILDRAMLVGTREDPKLAYFDAE